MTLIRNFLHLLFRAAGNCQRGQQNQTKQSGRSNSHRFNWRKRYQKRIVFHFYSQKRGLLPGEPLLCYTDTSGICAWATFCYQHAPRWLFHSEQPAYWTFRTPGWVCKWQTIFWAWWAGVSPLHRAPKAISERSKKSRSSFCSEFFQRANGTVNGTSAGITRFFHQQLIKQTDGDQCEMMFSSPNHGRPLIAKYFKSVCNYAFLLFIQLPTGLVNP